MPKITKINDNIITIEGEYKYKQDQIFKLSESTKGIVLMATEEKAKLLAIGDPRTIQTRTEVKEDSEISKIEVFDAYFGSIISPFGKILFTDKKNEEPIKIGESYLEAPSPSILERVKLSKPLSTGILAIDTMIPIGKGQRELIIGDRSTGKTSIIASTIINQRKTNQKTIYVAIGQKRSSVISFYKKLKEHNAHKNVLIIFANSESPAQQFLSPKIGAAMAEALAYKGEEVLVIYDDLTKHANIYREISLSIGKAPGREAYPTDIFYRHSRLLERAGRFNEKYNNGSITALPVVETIKGDIASVIPSNIISITDGQIFTSTDMYNVGQIPAINIGLSVSRTGSSVQSNNMKRISKGLKVKYSELFDIKKFADMSIDISENLKSKVMNWEGIKKALIQFGYLGYDEQDMEIIIELFKMNKLGKIIEPNDFSKLIKNFGKLNNGAIKLKRDLNEKVFKDDYESFIEAIKIVYLPLIETASGSKNEIISEKEFAKYKEVYNG